MAADDNAITDGSVTFNGKVIAPACTTVAATKDSVVTLPDVSATKLQTNGQVSGVQTDVPIELKDCDTTVTKMQRSPLMALRILLRLQRLLTSSSDAATNVALQMYMNDGTTAITPDTETGNILLQDGDQTLTFKVDYIATGKATQVM